MTALAIAPEVDLRVDRSLTVRQYMQKFGLVDALSGSITELAVNRPGEHWLKRDGVWERHQNEALTLGNLSKLATAIAVFNSKHSNRDNPIESMTLPAGERCQIVQPPVCEEGTLSITVRKPSTTRFTLEQYAQSGRLMPRLAALGAEIEGWEAELQELAAAGDFVRFFEKAVARKLNVVTVGGTGSGKTTFSKTLIDLYPRGSRIFTIEDAHELTTPHHPNSVHLFFSPRWSAKAVLASCMRMNPDHIFLTELRGDETWDYLMALKSGHSGSVTSIHANDCRGALYKIGSYIKQSAVGQTLSFEYIMHEVMTTIDVVVYFEDAHLKEIYYDPVKKLKLLRGEGA